MSDAALRRRKRELRASVTALVRSVGTDDRLRWSDAVARAVLELPCFRDAHIVLGFLPMPLEVDATPILSAAIAAGKRVGVPRMEAEGIRFHEVKDLAGPWETHPFGVREPDRRVPLIDVERIRSAATLVVAPGCAFDLRGGRLGYGKGYYDRFAAACGDAAGRGVIFLGVAFAIQVVEAVPGGPTDRPVDGLVTERGLVYASPAIFRSTV